MYIRTRQELTDLVASRQFNRDTIRKRRDEWASKRYGIDGLFNVLCGHFGPYLDLVGDTTYGLLARQIPSIALEDAAAFLLCRSLGIVPVAMPFTRDIFIDQNHDKLHRVKIPWIWWSKKGNLVVEYEYLAELKPQYLNHRPLGTIVTKNGVRLPDFHRELRRGVFGEEYRSDPDVSELWHDLLMRARLKPGFVYTLSDHGREKSVRATDEIFENGQSHTLRPPSEWYYPLYLSWFLDGSIVLLETYENPDGGVPEAKRLFEKAMREVEDGTGFRPLVVEVPPLNKEMLSCNRVLLERPGILQARREVIDPNRSIVEGMHQIAMEVRSMR